ncbi:hypothetical protein [Spiroplasma endosymbiont of Poecilobothrus nobilitatus]|uniref:hypothetical protein n=1 Tax=Spiroplasma endosymbiont of Poecilobothrus nobilitatus TaxID=1209220 RepID=UPI00313B212D
MKTEIYHSIINCLENIRIHLKLSQLKFSAFFVLTSEGYRLSISKDTNKNKNYVKIYLIHILSTILYNVLCKFKQQILSLIIMIITSFKINATIFLKKIKYL